MKLAFAFVLMLAIAVAACDGSKPAGPTKDLAVLGQMRTTAQTYHCTLTYAASHGPVRSQSQSVVTLVVDADGGTPGWKTTSLLVTEPLPDAQGFDPWLPFMTGLQQSIVRRDSATLVLADIAGAPLTLNTASHMLDWRAEGLLGPMSYAGTCS